MSPRRPRPPASQKAGSSAAPPPAVPLPAGAGLLPELRELILTTRQNVARGVNAALTILHWQMGDRIRREVLQETRAGYGDEIVSTLSRELTLEFGRGFSDKALRHMIRFAEAFPDFQIVSTLSRQLTWSHCKEIIYLKDDLQREFYAEMCRVEGWSVRTLREKIGGMLYERTALSRKPEELIRQELAALREEDRLTPDLVFKDPYFLAWHPRGGVPHRAAAPRGAAAAPPPGRGSRPGTPGAARGGEGVMSGAGISYSQAKVLGNGSLSSPDP